ncbi:leucine--tRNA ligase, cytoplasmic [Histomonas meleagridis]|uniref:leucine--tRNA ligase, cytoplasmic n=1 Tax=Histomonas meleagridis TaxID=135588 RepID=UPI0035597713|nr:leucine--tRNA ligase, cytoplasmic [Histomonas meleagridis]KAH0797526.1 leucine--tRNA ligase, cytoplasmic [Histomonas meleagridis]
MPAKGKAAEQQKVNITSFANDEVLKARVATLAPIEKEVHENWEKNHTFEVDAPVEPVDHSKKFFVTFPFPYMNGRIHLGHLYSFSKCEFAVRYNRMKGKYSLLPFGFHCTGMPIKASADKLALEIDNGIIVTGTTGRGSKASAKAEQGVSQFDILRHMGVPEEEIPEFRDPIKWLKYFPPLGMEDLKAYGSAVDWRRSFITTEFNPYFDHFVTWQFRILKRLGLVTFGKRPTICSIKDQQPCMDHDRASGEGVQPQEYTLIKLQLVDPKHIDERFGDYPVFLLAATLRPETMVGQTNYWIKPGVKYEVARSKDGKELYVCGARSLRNLAAQELVESFDPLFEIESDKFLLAECTHNTIDHKIKGLPLPGIKMNKGTGIVTCVPSDAPADYKGIIDLQKNAELRKKYNINLEDVADIKPILIITTKKYGDCTAKAVLDELKDVKMPMEEKLEEAKQRAYKEGFYHGTMILGPFKGQKVTEAKEKAKLKMVEENAALTYYEPEKEVISRSGDECVVMNCDQWYMEYGREDWKKKLTDYFDKVNVFHDEIREKFKSTFEWLGPHACSRQFGLGTHMPFAPEFLIDSLSDSTIYPAYYTIAHLLQGCITGAIPGIAKLTPDKINDEFFNCVFLNGPLPEGIPEETMKVFRREFEFWYPCDVRASGKDLVQNHLTMYLYNHIAIFPEDKWPLGIRVNGHVKLNNAKMSKSTGNFLTAVEAINMFSVTGVRIGLADASDGSDEANFDGTVVKSALLRLQSFTELVKNPPENMHEGIQGFADELFDARISKAIIEANKAYEKMMFKAALKSSFFELQNFWTEYCGMSETSISSTLRQRYIETFLLLLTPIIPEYTDYIWTHVLQKKSDIVNEKFPEPNPFKPDLFYMERLLRKTADVIKFRVRALRKAKGLNSATIFIRTKFNEIQLHVLSILRKHFNEEENKFNEEELNKEISEDQKLNEIKKSSKNGAQQFMPFLQFYRASVPEFGAFLLQDTPDVDQKELFLSNKNWFLRQLPGYKSLDVINVDEPFEAPGLDQKIALQAQVYMPTADLCSKPN